LRIILFVGFIAGLMLASIYSVSLVKPVRENDMPNLIVDIKLVQEHPGSSIVRTYRLIDLTIVNGSIIMGREQLWQFIYPQVNNTIYAPVYVRQRLYLNGLLITLNLTSYHLNGSIVVEVRRV